MCDYVTDNLDVLWTKSYVVAWPMEVKCTSWLAIYWQNCRLQLFSLMIITFGFAYSTPKKYEYRHIAFLTLLFGKNRWPAGPGGVVAGADEARQSGVRTADGEWWDFLFFKYHHCRFHIIDHRRYIITSTWVTTVLRNRWWRGVWNRLWYLFL
jgi:hypothetical protein